MRSRVTLKCLPTSSSVRSSPDWSRPKRILMISFSRGVSVESTSSVSSRRLLVMAVSAGVGAQNLVDDFDHVHGHADGPPLVGNRARHRLAYPPRRVGRELVAAPPVE